MKSLAGGFRGGSFRRFADCARGLLRIAALTTLFSVAAVAIYAQNQQGRNFKRDSLERVVRSGDGAEALNARIALVEILVADSALAEQLYRESLRQARKLDLPVKAGQAHVAYANHLRRNNRNDEMKRTAETALEIAETEGGLLLKLEAASLVGTFYARVEKDSLYAAAGMILEIATQAKAAGNDSLRAAALRELAKCYRRSGQNEKAVAYAETALEIAERTENYSKEGKLNILMLLSHAYAESGRMAEYLRHIKRYLRFVEENDAGPFALAAARLRAGNAFSDFGDHDRALAYYQKAFPELSRRKALCDAPKARPCPGYFKDLRVLCFNMAVSWNELSAADSARKYFLMGSELSAALGDANLKALGLFGAARNLRVARRPRVAVERLKTALGRYSKSISAAFRRYGEMELGLALAETNQPAEAAPLLRGNLAFYFGGNPAAPDSSAADKLIPLIKTTVFEGYRRLAKVYRALGKNDSAYLYSEGAALLERRALQKRLDEKRQALMNQYDLDDKQFQIRGLKSENVASEKALVRSRAVILVVSGGLLAIAAMLFFVWRNYKAKKTANKLLQQQKAELSSAYEEIRATNANLGEAYAKIEKQNLDLTDSIAYARRIQQAAQPPREQLEQTFDDFFLYYRPRDVVSGDFYWLAGREGLTYFAVCDATGHGVPGALMSVLGVGALNLIVNDLGLTDPGAILTALDARLTAALQQEIGGDVKDSIDLALCVIDPENKTLKYSGAGRPLWLCRRDGGLETYKGARCSTGGSQFEDKTFPTIELSYAPGDRVYLFTDGVTDQFGGEKKRKFGPRRLKEFIHDNKALTLKAQGRQFTQAFGAWHQSHKQLDDITLLAVDLS